jgi:protein tyrosine/serine phosphatase
MIQTRRILKYACAVLVLLAVSAGCVLAAARRGNNFHAISDGEAYRSAQPTAGEIEAYKIKYNISTIINLRGSNSGKSWYDSEIQISKDLGIDHIDFDMSSKKELTSEKALSLIRLMEFAPKPILIHCREGADRSGLAAAFYLAAVKKSGEAAAERQLSIRFGHVAIPFVGTYAMDRTFESMEPAFGFSGS